MNSDPQNSADHLVLIEDDPVTQLMVAEAMQHEGYQVTTADSGEDALGKIDQVEPSLILLDIMLPGINGFETCEGLRSRPATAHTPIILMTGLDDVESVNRGFAAGATDFISKPLNIALLIQRLRFVLRTSNAARALRRSEQRLAKAQKLARVSYWEYNLDTRVAELSPEVRQAFKCDDALVPVDQLTERFEHFQIAELIKAGHQAIEAGEPLMFEQTIRIGKDNKERTILHHAELADSDGDGQKRMLGTSQDITERKQAEKQIDSLANFDSLTGLPNRRFLRNYLAQALASIELDGEGEIALLALDLDLFKKVNDSMGYEIGDQLLKAVAKRLKQVVRSGNQGFIAQDRDADLIARVSGDEFVVAFRNIEGRRGTEIAAERILGAFERPFNLDGEKSVFISASIGVLMSPDDGVDVDSLLKGLDVALRTAKEQGRNNWQFYKSLASDTIGYPLALSSELRRALRSEELRLVYQPKYDADQRLIGLEALSRWEHHEIGPIAPDVFIPIAEESGQAIVLGNWVIDEACRQIREWLDQGFDCPPVAINVAARQCTADGLLDQITDSLARYKVPTRLLEVELTETALVASRSTAVERLSSLRTAGIRVALDDFGTGYSSLSYLKGLPIDQIKIDRSFIVDIITNSESAKIVEAIISLCHTLGLSVVAEGVEDMDQFNLLKQYDCDYFQGYALARPQESDALHEALAERTRVFKEYAT